jgi:adenine/guanine phosphoribosyltransferase-like PRPP-binding protein
MAHEPNFCTSHVDRVFRTDLVATNQTVEGDRNARTYVIVDDFIATGNTVRIIQEEITKWSQATCVGVMTAAVAREKRGTYVLLAPTSRNY